MWVETPNGLRFMQEHYRIRCSCGNAWNRYSPRELTVCPCCVRRIDAAFESSWCDKPPHALERKQIA